jgi:hypothetical protein
MGTVREPSIPERRDNGKRTLITGLFGLLIWGCRILIYMTRAGRCLILVPSFGGVKGRTRAGYHGLTMLALCLITTVSRSPS